MLSIETSAAIAAVSVSCYFLANAARVVAQIYAAFHAISAGKAMMVSIAKAAACEDDGEAWKKGYAD